MPGRPDNGNVITVTVTVTDDDGTYAVTSDHTVHCSGQQRRTLNARLNAGADQEVNRGGLGQSATLDLFSRQSMARDDTHFFLRRSIGVMAVQLVSIGPAGGPSSVHRQPMLMPTTIQLHGYRVTVTDDDGNFQANDTLTSLRS